VLAGTTCVSGACVCPAGGKLCSASLSCIPIAGCCTDSDCIAISGQVCSTPGGSCSCPSGKRVCNPTVGSPQCITNSATVCCVNSDCASVLTNSVCSGIGGSCVCQAGSYNCAANNSCISNNLCCTSSDCARIRNINGENCNMPGGTCSCPAS